MKKQKAGRALKPSQRESITEYSSNYSPGFSIEDKAKIRKIARIIIYVLGIIALICIGYFITEMMLRFSELPADTLFISTEAPVKWISSLTLQG